MPLGRIYKITDNTNDNVYIGSTTKEILQRLKQHESDYKSYLNGKFHVITSFKILENNDYDIELIEEIEFNNKAELFTRETYYINSTNNVVNKNKPNSFNSIGQKAYSKQYHQANKAQTKQYQQANKEHIKAYQQAYNKANKDKIKAYYKTNKEHIKTQTKQYKQVNTDKIKAYHQANKELKKLHQTKQNINNIFNEIAKLHEIFKAKCNKQIIINIKNINLKL